MERRVTRLEDAELEKLMAGGDADSPIQLLETGPQCFFDDEKYLEDLVTRVQGLLSSDGGLNLRSNAISKS